jgi:hypothetical protein
MLHALHNQAKRSLADYVHAHGMHFLTVHAVALLSTPCMLTLSP